VKEEDARRARRPVRVVEEELVAVILGWLILNERLTILSIVAMCVILAGVALVQTSRNHPPQPASNQVAAEEDAA